jgi:uncharacterized protein
LFIGLSGPVGIEVDDLLTHSGSFLHRKGRQQMVLLRFHGDLASLLVRRWRGNQLLELPLARRTSVKDFIEALGPPHTEVGMLLANGREVDFTYQLEPEDSIEVFAPEPPVDVSKPSRLRPETFAGGRFIADVNVGKLARLLRMLGVDVSFYRGLADADCAARARTEQRICLTTDAMLLKRRQIVHGHLVRDPVPENQLREVIHFYGLAARLRPFSRCLRCNDELMPVAKTKIIARLEPLTRKYYDAFERCPRCDRIYWAGSHREQMEKLIAALNLPRS